jgi:hypothetical protein
VSVEDVEAAAAVHQYLGELRVSDDGVNDKQVLTRVGDAVRVIFAAEGDGLLRPVEEGGRGLLSGEDLMPLVLALKPPAPSSPPSFLASSSFAAAWL